VIVFFNIKEWFSHHFFIVNNLFLFFLFSLCISFFNIYLIKSIDFDSKLSHNIRNCRWNNSLNRIFETAWWINSILTTFFSLMTCSYILLEKFLKIVCIKNIFIITAILTCKRRSFIVWKSGTTWKLTYVVFLWIYIRLMSFEIKLDTLSVFLYLILLIMNTLLS